MKRYEDNRENELGIPELNGQNNAARLFSVEIPRSFNGGTWDARHMTNFLGRSNYSNWKGDKKNISRISVDSPKRSHSYRGQHFFRTTKDNRNESKIGYTPIFPLVSNAPVEPKMTTLLNSFLQSSRLASNQQRPILAREMKLRCSPEQNFKFEANAVKFQLTDPLTLKHEDLTSNLKNGFQKQRMLRLISKRHPHGMQGIDHPENPQGQFYSTFQQSIKVRQQPNSRQTFLLDREWKQKKRSKPPVDEWKSRKIVTVRKFRNESVHGYNILTNRKLEE